MNPTTQSDLIPKLKAIHAQRLQQGYLGNSLAGPRAKAKRLQAEALIGKDIARATGKGE